MFRLLKQQGRSARDLPRKPPPDYFARSVRLRVGVLVFLFLTVLMLMAEARKPKNWAWMWNLQRPAAEERPGSTSGAPSGMGSDLPVDTRAPDGVLADPATTTPRVSVAEGDSRPAADFDRAWAAVEDNTILRSADRDAWRRSWELLETHRSDVEVAAEAVSFLQLFAQPQVYRGRAVRVVGTARHGYRVVSSDPRSVVREYHVLWLQPDDGNNSPIVVYLRDLPSGFPNLPVREGAQAGATLRQDVVVTGLFFKRWLYASRDGPRLAPLVLGRITQWSAPRETGDAEALPVSPRRVLFLVVATAVLGIGIAVWVYRGSRWSAREGIPLMVRNGPLPTFDEAAVQPTVVQRLQRLEGDEDDAT